jgi:hypothetical protein
MIHDSASEAELSPIVIETSSEYVGRWNLLVSTTNWEKGRIIYQWRQALQQAGAPVAECTDETWAQQVGGVTPQHVGRLRRVHERYGDICQQYPGLFWSHFYTALDWPDAEMWLEGAMQNDWSISQMRNQRWEALGAPPELKPQESEIFVTETDSEDLPTDNRSVPDSISETFSEAHDTETKSEHSSDSAPFDEDKGGDWDSAASHVEPAALFRPFEKLPAMPADLNEAFELFKLSIISHKLTGWQDIALDNLLAILDALKQLAVAPTE